MSANVETLHAMYAAFGRGDVPGVLANLTDDVEWEYDWGREPIPLLRERRGREEVSGFFAELAPFEFLRFDPFAFLEGGDMVTALIHVHLRHRGTRREVRDLEAHLWTFAADGRARRLRHLVDTRQLAWATGAA
jgi:hypothetical protein